MLPHGVAAWNSLLRRQFGHSELIILSRTCRPGVTYLKCFDEFIDIQFRQRGRGSYGDGRI